MNLHDFFNEGREIKEGVMKDIHIELSDIVANEDFDALYKLFSADTPAGRFVQDMYDDIVIDTGLHPDDDFERIEQIVFDRLADEFGEEGMSENSLNEFAADDGNDGGEDDALRNYARMWWGGDEATQMQIERALARMGWEIGEDEGGYDNGGVFVVRAGDVNGNSYQSWAAEDLTEGLTEIDRRGFLKGMGAAAVAGTAGGANAFDFGKKNNEKKFEDFITEPADKEKYLGLHKKAKQLYTAMVINPSLRAAAYVEIAAFKKFKKQMAEKYKISDNLDEQGVVEGRLTNFDNLSDAELIRLAHRGYISGNLEYNHDGHLVNRDEIIRLLKATDDSAEENDDDFTEQGMAEGLGYSQDPAQAKWYHEGRKAFKGGTTGNLIQDIAKKHGVPEEWIDAFHAGYQDQEGFSKNTVDEGDNLATFEQAGCNQTMEGEYCPEHGMAECGGMYESQLARIKSLAYGR